MRLQFAGNKIAVAILLLLKIHQNCVTAELTCHECHGINCLRTSYNATQKCMNDLDICVTVFEKQTVVYQGCLEQLSQVLRNKCNPNVEEVNDQQNSLKLSECFKCNGNLCNNLASEPFKCIQCDSNSDTDCRSKPENLIPKKCVISRSPNEYCFAKREGERIVRGCTYTLEEQTACLSSEDCMICQPSEINNCNTMALLIDGSESAGSDNGVNGSSEGSEGGSSANGGSGGSGNDNNGGGSSANGGNDGNDNSGSGSSANEGNDGNDNSGSGSSSNGGNNANDSNGGGSSESGGGSVNGGSESDGNVPDDSGNTSSENGSSESGSDNSQGGTSGVASNASITIVKIYIWIFTIFLIFLVKF